MEEKLMQSRVYNNGRVGVRLQMVERFLSRGLGLRLFFLLLVGLVGTQGVRAQGTKWMASGAPGFVNGQNKVICYEGFEGVELDSDKNIKTGECTRTYTAPSGWYIAKLPWDYKESVNNSRWFITSLGGVPGGDDKTLNSRPGFAARETKNCAVGMLSGGKMRSALLSPRTNLSGIKKPALIFYYASYEYNGSHDELSVEYCIGGHSDHPEDDAKDSRDWKKLKELTSQVLSYELITLSLPEELLQEEDVRFRFVFEAGGGGGIVIDEIMIVETAGVPISMRTPAFYMYKQPAGAGYDYQPTSRLQFEITTGDGSYRLDECNLKVHGADKGLFESISLYAVDDWNLPPYNERDKFLMGRVTNIPQDGVLTKSAFVDGKDENWVFTSGRKTIYVVANLKESAKLREKFSVSIPSANSWKFVRCSDLSGKKPIDETTEYSSCPNDDAMWAHKESQSLVVYQTLFSDDFTTEDRWGTRADNSAITMEVQPSNSDRSLLPWRGSQMAVAENIEKNNVAMWHTKNPITVLNYRDVTLSFRLSSKLSSDGLFEVRVYDKDPSEPGNENAYNVAYAEGSFSAPSWVERRVTLSASYDPVLEKVWVAFVARAGQNGSAFYLDDVRIIGDKVDYDLSVGKITPPSGMIYDENSVFSVQLVNVGAKETDGEAILELRVGGEKQTQNIPQGMVSKQSRIFQFKGFTNLKGKTEDLYNNLLSVEAEIKWEKDQEPENNIRSYLFLAFPRYTILGTQFYPPNMYAMPQWYPSAPRGFSWLRDEITNIGKAKSQQGGDLVPPFGVGLHTGSEIWTTGRMYANKDEESYLESPLFELKDNETQQLIVRYALSEKDTEKLEFQYRTADDPRNWKVLEKMRGGKGWYTASEPWKGDKDGEGGFRLARVLLPQEVNKAGTIIQFRAYFKAKGTSKGVAFNTFEVRPPRPDLVIRQVTPESGCGKVLGSQPLKLTIANEGDVSANESSLGNAVKNGKVRVPVVIKVYERTQKNNEPDSVLVSEVIDMFEYSVPFNPNDTREFTTSVSFNWDKAPMGYAVHIELMTETQGELLRDEDVDNNFTRVLLVKSGGGDHPIANLIPTDVEAHKYDYYYATDKTITPVAPGEMSNPYMEYSNYKWEAGTATYTGGTSGESITITGDGTLKFSYTMQEKKAGETVGAPCEITLELNVKRAGKHLVVKPDAVSFSSQQTPTDFAGCYMESGESLQVTVTNEESVAVSNVEVVVLVDGKQQATGSISTIGGGGTASCTVNGVRIPAGYSSLQVYARVKGESGPLNFSTSCYEQRVYRLKEREQVQVFLRFMNDSRVYTSLESLSLQGGDIDLLNPKGEGLPYLWIMRAPGETVTWMELDGKSGEWRKIPEKAHEDNMYLSSYVKGSYKVVVESPCGGPKRESAVYRVIAYDIKVNKISPTVCSDGKNPVPLVVELQNVGTVVFEKGTKLEFEARFHTTGKTKKFSMELPESFKNTRDPLAFAIGEMAVEGADKLIEFGDNDVEVKLLTVDGEKELNSDNNIARNTLQVWSAPLITFQPGDEKHKMTPPEIHKVFQSGESYELPLKVDGVHEGYKWEFSEDGQSWEEVLGGNKEKLMVEWNDQKNEGPASYYKLTVTHYSGCKSSSQVHLVQTDMSFTIEGPNPSSCGYEKTEQVSLVIENTGSKPLPKNTKINITLSSDGIKSQEKSILLGESLGVRKERKEFILYQDFFSDFEKSVKDEKTMHIAVKFGDTMTMIDVEPSNNKKSQVFVSLPKPEITLYVGEQEIVGKKIESFTSPMELGVRIRKTSPRYRPKAEIIYLDAADVDKSKISFEGEDYSGDAKGYTHNDVPLPDPDKTKGHAAGKYRVFAVDNRNCADVVEFDLDLQRMNLALEAVEMPKSACEISPSSTIKYTLKNTGTVSIDPEGLQVTLKADITKEDGTDLLDKNGKKIDFEEFSTKFDFGQNSIPVNDSRSFWLRVKELNNVPDGTKVKITNVRFELSSSSTKGHDLLQYNDPIDDIIKNSDGNPQVFEVEDYPSPEAKELSVIPMDYSEKEDPEVLLAAGETYYYKSRVEVSGNDLAYLHLGLGKYDNFRIKKGGKIRWILGAGLNNAPGKPAINYDEDRNIYVRGGGKVRLVLEDQQGCKNTVEYFIYPEAFDLEFSVAEEEIEKLQNGTCFENLPDNIPLPWKIKNISETGITLDEKYQYQVDISYKVEHQVDGSLTPLHTSTPETIAIMSSSGLRNFSAKNSVTGTFFIPKSVLKGAGKYVVTLEMTFDKDKKWNDSKAVDGNEANNKFELKDLEYFAPITLDKKYLGDAKFFDKDSNLKVYQETGNLYVNDDELLLKYKDFTWTFNGKEKEWDSKKWGSKPKESYIKVEEPGEYTLSFIDEHGCKSTGVQTVRYPGYYVLDTTSMRVSGGICSQKEEIVTFSVRNAGKEPLEITKIPIKLWNIMSADEIRFSKEDLHELIRKGAGGSFVASSENQQPVTVAPGASQELTIFLNAAATTPHTVPVHTSGTYEWYMRLSKKNADIVSEDWDLIARDSLSCGASHKFDRLGNPPDPNLKEQIKNGLQIADKMRLPRDGKVVLDAKKGMRPFDVQYYEYEWSDGSKSVEASTFNLNREVSDGEFRIKLKLRNTKGKSDDEDCVREFTTDAYYFEKKFLIETITMGDELGAEKEVMCSDLGNDASSLRPVIDVKCKLKYADTLFLAEEANGKQPIKLTMDFDVQDKEGASKQKGSHTFLLEGGPYPEDDGGKEFVFKVSKDQLPIIKPNELFKVSISKLEYPTSFYLDEKDQKETKNLGTSPEHKLLLKPKVEITNATNGKIEKTGVSEIPIDVKVGNEYQGAKYTYELGEKTVSLPIKVKPGDSESHTYVVRVKDGECVGDASVDVFFLYTFSYVFDYGENLGSVEVESVDAQKQGVSETVSNGGTVPYGTSLIVKLKPKKNAAIDYYDDGTGLQSVNQKTEYKFDYKMPAKNVTLKVGFSESFDDNTDDDGDDNNDATPVDIHDKNKVYCVSPVTSSLQLFRTERVKVVELYSLLGNRLMRQEVGGEATVVLPVSTLPAGYYLVKVYTRDGDVQTLRVIKQ